MTTNFAAVLDAAPPPPSDLDAERAALGAALLNAGARATVLAMLEPEDFFDPANRQLFGHLADVIAPSLEPGEEPDLVTVSASLRAAGLLEVVGGDKYLIDLCDSVPTVGNAGIYCRILRAKSALRVLRDGAINTLRTVARPDADAAAIAGQVQRAASKAAARVADDGDGACGAPVLIQMSNVAPRDVPWLWPQRFPAGRVTLLVGRCGEGKSFFAIDAASRVSTGSPWPDGGACPQGSVILIAGEDDPHDVIRPRLDACHADCDRIQLLRAVRRAGKGGTQEAAFTLADIGPLAIALKRNRDCKLVVIDPVGSFLGGNVDAHRDNEVRAILNPLVKLAEEHGPAVLLIAHRRKSAADFADDLALGSRAFTGVARAVWHLMRDADDRKRRLLLPGKCNLTAEPAGLAFGIGGTPPTLIWEREPVRLRADDLAQEAPARRGPLPEERGRAETWLRDFLADGPKLADECLAAAQTAEPKITTATLRRAREAVGITARKRAFGGGWEWAL